MASEPPATNQLIAILMQGHESKKLDYKAAVAWNETDKASCCALVKDILAMANTRGGFIVIGVSEHATEYSFDGVGPAEAKTFDTTRLNRFLQGYTDPPINALLRKVVHDGKTFVLIEVPPFPDTPHVCQKEYPGVLSAHALYVRTDNNESAPLKSATDFKNLIERAVRNRGDALLGAFRSILTSGSKPPEPSARDHFLARRADAIAHFEEINPLKAEEPLLGYLESSFLPEHFDAKRFAIPELRKAVERAHVTYLGWPFLSIHPNRPDWTYVIQDGMETFLQTKDFGGFYVMDFWRLQQSGLFYQRTLLRPSAHPSNVPAADLRNIAMYVAMAIDCLTRLYDGLFPDTEYVTLQTRILNTNGRKLVSSWPATMPTLEDHTCRIPEILVEQRLPLADWRAAIVDHAVTMTKEMYLRFNWPEPNVSLASNVIERMFARKL